MTKYLWLALFLVSTAANAKITGWKKYQIPYNYILSNDLAKRHCGYLKPVTQAIKERNQLQSLDKLRIGDYIELPICHGNEELYISSSEEYPLEEKPRPVDNSSNIVSWEKLKVPRGYILSKDLALQKKCNLNWTKQLQEFQAKNPNVKNPNVIFSNKEIWIQTCKNEELNAELKKAGVSEEELKKLDASLTYLIDADFRFDLYGGIAYLEKLSHLVGVGIRSNVYKSAGFELKMMNFGENFFLLGEFEYKDPNNYQMQYNFTLGIIDYVLTDVSPQTQSSGTLYATYGYIFRPSSKVFFEAEAGLNLAANLGWVGYLSGMRKISSQDRWLGLFLESRSFTTPQKNQNNLVLGGLKLSF